MTTVLYARVSTSDQTVDHQEEYARSAGFDLDYVVSDCGVSGVATKLEERPEGRRLFDILRAGDTLVVRWVDRLGRNYEDVTNNIRRFMGMGVTIRTVINGLTFDAQPKDDMSKAVRDALIAFMAASAAAQAEATKEAQTAGIAYKKTQEPEAYKGRKPTYTNDQVDQIIKMIDAGMGNNTVARALALSPMTVSRINADRVKAYAVLERWT